MNLRQLLHLALNCAALVALPLRGAEPRPTTVESFDAFRLIGDRNIFDPTRTPRTVRNTEEAPKSDYLALVGTLNYEKGLFAVFDSSVPALRKSVKLGDTLGDFTVTRIDHSGVELTRNAQKSALLIGRQILRPPGGDWATTAIEVERSPAPSAPTAAAAPTGTTNDSTTPAPSGSSADVLKRLLEQRQKQLKP